MCQPSTRWSRADVRLFHKSIMPGKSCKIAPSLQHAPVLGEAKQSIYTWDLITGWECPPDVHIRQNILTDQQYGRINGRELIRIFPDEKCSDQKRNEIRVSDRNGTNVDWISVTGLASGLYSVTGAWEQAHCCRNARNTPKHCRNIIKTDDEVLVRVRGPGRAAVIGGEGERAIQGTR